MAALSHSNSDDWREIMGIFSEIGTLIIALPPYTWLPNGPLIILINLINAIGIHCLTLQHLRDLTDHSAVPLQKPHYS